MIFLNKYSLKIDIAQEIKSQKLLTISSYHLKKRLGPNIKVIEATKNYDLKILFFHTRAAPTLNLL
jgi:hypothetical protein